MQNFFPLSLVTRLALTLNGLHAAVAARRAISVLAGRGTEVLAEALIVLICGRIRRTQNRILLLLERFQAGRLRVWRPGRVAVRRAVPREVKGVSAREIGTRSGVKIPRSLAWLLPLVPCEAANFASQLRGMLAEPEMVALLAASAQARRVLQPLGRMLGIEPALLAPGGAPVDPGALPDRADAVRALRRAGAGLPDLIDGARGGRLRPHKPPVGGESRFGDPPGTALPS